MQVLVRQYMDKWILTFKLLLRGHRQRLVQRILAVKQRQAMADMV